MTLSFVSITLFTLFSSLIHSYASKGHLIAKSDVYSFGIVLLEMLSGKRAIDKNRPQGEHSLVEWAKPYITSRRKALQIFDARIEGQYTMERALKAVKLAIQCISTEPNFRPTMNYVVKALEQLQESDDDIDIKSMDPFQSQGHQNLSGSNPYHKKCENEVSNRNATSYSQPCI